MDNPLLTLAEEWEKAAVDNGELSGDCELKNGMWYEGMWYAGMAHGFTAAAAALRSYVERCAYRPGLPSVEAVKAHEARGGRWQVLDPGCHLDPEGAKTLRLRFRDDAIRIQNGYAFWQRLDMCSWAERAKYRPCSPSGDPLPWEDAA